MTCRVILQRLAIQDLDDAFVWAARKAPSTARPLAGSIASSRPCSAWTRIHNTAPVPPSFANPPSTHEIPLEDRADHGALGFEKQVVRVFGVAVQQ
jgi:hypothetical protein